MPIKIGNNNKIKNSSIIDNSNSSNSNESDIKESFASKHPLLIGIVGSIIASIIMTFSFWENISHFIKNQF